MRLNIQVPEGGGQQAVRVTRSDGQLDMTLQPGSSGEFTLWKGATLTLEEVATAKPKVAEP